MTSVAFGMRNIECGGTESRFKTLNYRQVFTLQIRNKHIFAGLQSVRAVINIGFMMGRS